LDEQLTIGRYRSLLFSAILAMVLSGLMVMAFGLQEADAKAKKKVDTAKGKGSITIEGEGAPPDPVRFNFSAHNRDTDPPSDSAKGTFSLKTGDQYVKGEVTCLQVSGGNATFAGSIKKTNVPDLEEFFVFSAFDSGELDGAGDTLGLEPRDADDCSIPTESSGEIDSGNIKIRDVVLEV
jgi:hypothetical protein